MYGKKWDSQYGQYITIDEWDRKYPANAGPTRAERDLQATVDKLKAERDAMPKLDKYEGLASLGPKGVYTANTVSGQDIATEMRQSPWYRMALEKQQAEQSSLMNRGAQESRTAAAQAMSGLASRGGLRGGAAERLNMQSADNLALMKQNIRGQGAIERSNLGMQGADLASKMLQSNTNALNDASKFNVQANILDLGARENRKLRQYEEQMKLKGGEAAARAQSSGGKK